MHIRTCKKRFPSALTLLSEISTYVLQLEVVGYRGTTWIAIKSLDCRDFRRRYVSRWQLAPRLSCCVCLF